MALTVKDFNYYIGHAYVSLSRLNVSMISQPPRNISLTAPRRTEMRRMMQQMRQRHAASAAASDGPSGYIVDISRDDQPSDGSQLGPERRSTRAVVNRAPPGQSGGGGRPMGSIFPAGGFLGNMGLGVSPVLNVRCIN